MKRVGWKIIIALLAEIILVGAAFCTDLFKILPIWAQVLLILAIASIHLLTDKVFNYIKMQAENSKLANEKEKIQFEATKTQKELSELQSVVVSFLEFSEIYRQKVKDHFDLNEDFLCIVKSSEGLSDVYDEMQQKEQFPFGKVLSRIPGAIQPFERIALFLIPLRSLQGLNEKNIQRYIEKRIIPEVEIERTKFLQNLPKKISKKADKFSYKYIAFLLRKESIAYDTVNRKFNREFNAFIVTAQTIKNIEKMKTALQEVIKLKDLLLLTDWSSFVKLNPVQSDLITKNRKKIFDKLISKELSTLSEIYNSSESQLLDTLWPVIKKQTTLIKAKNLTKKVFTGIKNTVEILRKNGVSI